MKTSRALLGVLAGLAAGAAIGILFAPAKGERTRRNISRKGEEFMDDLEALVDERLNSTLNKVVGKIKQCGCTSGTAQENREAKHAPADNR
jgi:gas vesicle protein